MRELVAFLAILGWAAVAVILPLLIYVAWGRRDRCRARASAGDTEQRPGQSQQQGPSTSGTAG